jgi:L-cystine uptake protein TcyP (sodium:dicarboxylate symporter family)
MTHFLAMVLFSFFVSIAFATLSSDHHTTEERIKYGLRVFAYFVGVGLLIAWVLYLLPF